MKRLPVLLLVLSCGCATIINGPRQMIVFTSEPDGATILINNSPHGVTPASIMVETKQDHGVVLRKDGYRHHVSELRRKVSGWTFGNLLFGGIIGFIVDAISGANFELEPKAIHAILEPAATEELDSVQRTLGLRPVS